MMASFEHHAMSPQAYLDWEAHQEIGNKTLARLNSVDLRTISKSKCKHGKELPSVLA